MSIWIEYGALSDPIEDQLNSQGFTLGENAELFEKLAFGISLCYIHNILTDRDRDKCINRLHKEIIKKIKRSC